MKRQLLLVLAFLFLLGICQNAMAEQPEDVTGIVVSNVTCSSAYAIWNSSDYATFYRIYLNGTFYDEVFDTEYNFVGLSASTFYQFTILAYNQYGPSANAKPIYFYTSQTIAAPTNIIMHEWGSAFVITWTASTSSNVSGYLVKRVYPSGGSSGTTISTSYGVNSMCVQGMNVFAVGSYNLTCTKYGTNVGCYYQTSSKNAISLSEIENIKEEYGLSEIYFVNDQGVELIKHDEICLYPNPVINYLYVNGVCDFKATIFDINGKSVLSEMELDNKVDVSNLMQGIYYIKIEKDNINLVKKFIKK